MSAQKKRDRIRVPIHLDNVKVEKVTLLKVSFDVKDRNHKRRQTKLLTEAQARELKADLGDMLGD